MSSTSTASRRRRVGRVARPIPPTWAWWGTARGWVLQQVDAVRRALTPVDVGIDLGTANTLITVRGKGLVLSEPSMVAVQNENGERRVVAVGKDAKAMLGRTPRGVEVIRPLRDGVIADFEVAQSMIEHLLRLVRSESILRPRVVICVPCGATSMERRAIAEAAERVGVRSVALIDEPIAAAIGAGLPITSPQGSMVVDVGGGTTEIAVLSLGGVAYAQSVRVGGDHMDEAIVAWTRREHSTLVGLSTAEQIKIQIGHAQGDDLGERRLKVRGLALVEGLPRELELGSAEVGESLRQPVAAIVAAVKEALANTPPDLAADVAERGICLTGGGALLHGLAEAIAAETKLRVTIAESPLTCVVRGTSSVLTTAELKGFAKAAA